MKSIDSVEIRGKKVLLRVDLNSPIDFGKVVVNPRIVAHSHTVKELSEKGAKLIVLAHQGQKGKPDFASLEQHCKIVEQLSGRKITFVDDVIGVRVTKAIELMQNGDVIMLDNVRFMKDETEGDPYTSHLVSFLCPLADLYVLDALSVAHRVQASVVGFSKCMPCYAGPILTKEVNALEKVRHNKDVTFIFGGAKPKDSIRIIKYWLGTGHVHKILTGGAVGMLFLHAKGIGIGTSLAFLEKNEGILSLEDAKHILEKYSDKIVLPVDVAVRIEDERVEFDVHKIKEGGIWDIGEKTIEEYKKIIQSSKVIVINGPVGVYEITDFAKGTREIFKALENYDTFTLCGGGHTITAIEMFGIDRSKLGYVSLAGKAFMEFLAGKELPGITAIKEAKH
ncbi:MAG: phosphoglycerate kinase [Candidatus Micrarchaeota archaeon]